MTAPVKDCPQPDYPIRERAYTPEQIATRDSADTGMWRPKTPARLLLPYDLIRDSEHARLEAKWQLFQARRHGERSEDVAQRERNVAYYDVAIPRWKALRAETEAQRVRMLRAGDDCAIAADEAVSAFKRAAQGA